MPHNRHPPRTHHPTPFLFILLKLQTGWGFPRPIFTQHYGSRAARVDSRASFLPSITVPAPHGWIPAPHFYSALRFPRRSGENPRSIFLQYHGSRAAPVGSRAPFFCSISVPAPQRWVPAPHFSAALRFPRRTGGFPRPIFMQHHGSRAARVDSRAPFLCSTAPHSGERSKARCVYRHHSVMFVFVGTVFVTSHHFIMSIISCLAQRISRAIYVPLNIITYNCLTTGQSLKHSSNNYWEHFARTDIHAP